MGGSAFKQAAAPGQPTLSTPRMSPAEYDHLKETYLRKLQAYFDDTTAKVATMKEAPEKQSYGDIDFFVGTSTAIDFIDLANAVGATAVICHGDKVCSLGVRRDGKPSPNPVIVYQNLHANGVCSPESTPEDYAQVDIEVILPDLVDWHLFYSAYSDLNGLLGRIVSPLGFTVTDQGIWLRMKELDDSKSVENANVADNLGKIFLSNRPEQVMRFLGLSTAKWDAGFTTMDELYEWLGACRMLHPASLRLKRDKAHEKKREETRSVYRICFSEWLPEHKPNLLMEMSKDDQVRMVSGLRQKYLDEALDFFSKRSEYEAAHRIVVATMSDAIASNLLRPIIAKHSGASAKKMPELMRAFRRFVVFDAVRQPCLAQVGHTDAESQLHKFLNQERKKLADEKAADAFVRSHWERAKELERARAKGKAGACDRSGLP